MDFLKSGAVCYLREAENENRRSPFDPYFAALLEDVKEAGIPIEAVRCLVSEEGMVIDSAVPIMQMKEG